MTRTELLTSLEGIAELESVDVYWQWMDEQFIGLRLMAQEILADVRGPSDEITNPECARAALCLTRRAA